LFNLVRGKLSLTLETPVSIGTHLKVLSFNFVKNQNAVTFPNDLTV